MLLRATLRAARASAPLRRISTSRHPLGSNESAQTEANVLRSPFPDVVLPDVNVSEFIWQRLDEWPDRTAVVCGVTGRSLTFAEMRASCRRLACALRRAGCAPGQVLAIALPNTPDFPLVALAAIEAQLVVTTVNPAYTPGEIAKQLVDSEARVIVTLPEGYDGILQATRLSGLQPPPLILVAESSDGRTPHPAGVPRIKDMIAADVDEPLDSRYRVASDTPAVIPYSSGTTGLPKGVLLSHRNLVAGCLQLSWSPRISLTEATSGTNQDGLMGVLPFFHIYGLVTVLLSKLQLGNKIVTLPRFEPTAFLNSLIKHRPVALHLVPPLVLFLGAAPAATPEHLASVRYALSGAAPLGEQDVLRLLAKAPNTECLQAYGLTETSPGLFHAKKGSGKLSSVGPCMPSVRAKVVDVETGATLGVDVVGEVCVKGPQNMLGYHRQPAATAQMIDADGWLHTGDLGRHDSDGDFYVVDRLKELIKVKGMQVAPAELEELVRSHPDVLDAAVVGVPDERAGERPLAFVVPRPHAKVEGLVERVQALVATQAAEHKHLVGGVRIVEAIPKSAAGKILRKELRAQLARERS